MFMSDVLSSALDPPCPRGGVAEMPSVEMV